MMERDSLECLVEVVVMLIDWDLSQTREGSLDLMEGVVENLSLSTAVKFEEYLEDLAPGLTVLVSFAVVHNCARTKFN